MLGSFQHTSCARFVSSVGNTTIVPRGNGFWALAVRVANAIAQNSANDFVIPMFGSGNIFVFLDALFPLPVIRLASHSKIRR